MQILTTRDAILFPPDKQTNKQKLSRKISSLVEVQIGASTLENSFYIIYQGLRCIYSASQQFYFYVYSLEQLFHTCISRHEEEYSLQHSIQYSQAGRKLVSISNRIEKLVVMYSHNGILHYKEKKMNCSTHNTDERSQPQEKMYTLAPLIKYSETHKIKHYASQGLKT